jgi:hypothetical protein
MSEPERVAWERQVGESSKAYRAFCRFRDAGPHRSIRKAWLAEHPPSVDGSGPESGSVSSRWRAWSTHWGWQERAAMFDRDVDEKKSRAFLAAQVAACERHARAAAAGLQIALIPIRVVLDRMQAPEFMAELGTLGAVMLLREARAGLSLVPGLVVSERLSLGLTTEAVQVEDHRDLSFANAVAANPRATDHLIACLDEIAGPGSGTSDGAHDDT